MDDDKFFIKYSIYSLLEFADHSQVWLQKTQSANRNCCSKVVNRLSTKQTHRYLYIRLSKGNLFLETGLDYKRGSDFKQGFNISNYYSHMLTSFENPFLCFHLDNSFSKKMREVKPITSPLNYYVVECYAEYFSLWYLSGKCKLFGSAYFLFRLSGGYAKYFPIIFFFGEFFHTSVS